jgi:hypothetical protein
MFFSRKNLGDALAILPIMRISSGKERGGVRRLNLVIRSKDHYDRICANAADRRIRGLRETRAPDLAYSFFGVGALFYTVPVRAVRSYPAHEVDNKKND